ncbi:MAG: PolC-type DNA polymerase III [Lachnospiraceae bacterium]|nr:PolC-type DNA polymerase III [Lachnospiraceae bacterium]
METKFFAEVFPTLNLNSDIKDLFGNVEVTRVTRNRANNAVRIYIKSNRLIEKNIIRNVENEIHSQVFENMPVKISIMEKFSLSGQYTPDRLYKVYRESILSELKDYSIIEYNMLNKAKYDFSEEGIMTLTTLDSPINRAKETELIRILEKIFCERCGIPVEVRIVYKKEDENKHENYSRQKIKLEVEAVMNNITDEKEELHESTEKEEEKKQTEKRVQKEEKTQPSAKNERTYTRSYKKSDNPDVLYGRDFDGEEIAISSIEGEMGEVIIHGKIIALDKREIRNEKTIIMFDITDFTDTITVKMFTGNDRLDEILPAVAKGSFIRLKGITTVDRFDSELTIASVSGIKKAGDFTTKRTDTSIEKRVELHCHTKMSDMDGVTSAKDLIKRAIEWGHKALAITDHGLVQGFPEAFHALRDIEGKYKWEPFDFKIIYGVEAYLVDDIKNVVTDSKGQSLDDRYVVFDLETTGFSAINNKIIEIGAVKVENGIITDRFSTFVNPKEPIPFRIEKLTGISDNMVIDARTIEEIMPEFLEFAKGCVMVAHNADFDMSFIIRNCERMGIDTEFTILDTVNLSRILLPNLKNFKLDTVAKALNVPLLNHHRAVDDAGCTAEIFVKLIEILKEKGIFNLDGVNEIGIADEQTIMKMPTHHAIILATGEVGRVNLYHLISDSHVKYFHRFPRIPKSDYLKYKEGLLIGSACEAGELYQAVLEGKSDEEIARLVEFYDYLEIQPIGNNEFMIKSEKSSINSKEELMDINRKIVKLGEDFNKPVVATCDVHFMDPEDEVYRRIIMTGKGFKDADDQAPLYYRTTEEMLEEFKYLGSEKAYEVVVKNTNMIADKIDNIFPVSPHKAPPVIENSDQTLRDICYDTAHSMYGENLPDIVVERLERELNSIISNGYAVMYIIAQKLVWKSNEDGYLVGSRGSVGSSFVATMSGITEVNPLSPHYYCAKCHYYEFDSEEVKKYTGGSGCDMPDKVCPDCGEKLVKAGFDIPFETFLGFKGNKEPDIDLNFSGEYQSKAHEYTEVIFGKGQTFRAGTIGTLADKTAYGYVKKYFEERGIHKRRCEINRISQGCIGIHRTTGQHPGGIVVLPLGEDINTYTPVQHPANDMTTKTVTTHFEYHSIDHNLLKLDILGHDDPTMIRMLEDLTGIDAKQIPFDNKEVMSLFQDTHALGINPSDIGDCPLGSQGIPEFGTEFVIQMLIDTKPQSFSDLIRISGLSHGTDVWLGNAQTLILEGKATISTAICTRDDIMIYLINKGLDSELSFTIMESVRKGKGLKPEFEEEMLAHDVPDWYIWSCKKIKYMFPKAHAAAYVMMAFRIAYFKVYYPLAYYAAYFSIRASAFSYELMCLGQERLEYHIRDYKNRDAQNLLSKKDEDTLKDMKVVQEMYARGYDFEPIDIYTVEAHKFQIMNGKLMPALSSIDGLGDKAADAIVEAAKNGKFISKDDFRERTKVSTTLTDLMAELGILKDLPESNQLSLFDVL